MASKGWCGSGLWPRQLLESGPIWKQRKAKKQAAERTQRLDKDRKKVKLDLEARERQAQAQGSEEEEERRSATH